MRILATYNIKGGVGKTAAAVNLAYLATQEGARTLIWDLDPQGAATYYFRIKPKVKGGSRGIIGRKRELDTLIKGTDFPGLDLLPADFSYRHLDLALDGAKKPTKRLRNRLQPLGEEYDYAFLDCPPSISLVSEAVFEAAETLLVPIIPTTLSLRTLDQLMGFRAKSSVQDLEILPFFSMVDRRRGLHRRIVEELLTERPQMLGSAIPYASEVEQMGLRREPLGCYAQKSRSALAYQALWQEIKDRID
jgi:cellulose biosynthesis protein BcsQ